ncbi:helix-turn-helix domain-containing protein [Streptomyces sp. NPDC005408]|uniref:winged helix-turn-helix transcriptional regulator n=1 Tax=Streptomyces sp. NPDC005408 TaxID=3155341 RepID=UPI0033A1FA23
MENDEGFDADCRARLAFDLVAHIWNPVVVWALSEGPRRPRELREQIGGISSKVLTETLRRLEHSGLVSRRSYREAPPRVEYELTTLGRSLLEPIEALGRWAVQHGDEIVRIQERAEARRQELQSKGS